MIRDRSSGCAAAAMSIDWSRSSPGSSGGPGIEHQRAADLDLVAAGQPWLRTRWPLTKVPLELFRSASDEIVVAAAELGVMAGDFGVVELDRRSRRRVPVGGWRPPTRNASPDRFRGSRTAMARLGSHAVQRPVEDCYAKRGCRTSGASPTRNRHGSRKWGIPFRSAHRYKACPQCRVPCRI